eukprot:6186386-Pleurochrysis_carterae.AAC.1
MRIRGYVYASRRMSIRTSVLSAYLCARMSACTVFVACHVSQTDMNKRSRERACVCAPKRVLARLGLCVCVRACVCVHARGACKRARERAPVCACARVPPRRACCTAAHRVLRAPAIVVRADERGDVEWVALLNGEGLRRQPCGRTKYKSVTTNGKDACHAAAEDLRGKNIAFQRT